MTGFPIPSISDHLPIALRAFAGPQFRELRDPAKPKSKRQKSTLGASPWTLIFDTETTTDAGQSLRFGTYQVRNAGELHEAGIFFEPDGVTANELEALRQHADANGLRLRTREEFNDEIFFGIGYQFRATIIGFNLPFDISRIAIAHGSARTEMRGGFSFTLSQQKIYPHVQVKHLSQRMAFIRFAATMRQPEGRGFRKRGQKVPHRAGHFVDLKTLAGALFARSFSLASLSRFLNIENPKLDFDDFAGPVTDDMVRYAVRDVQTTWECYVELIARLNRLGLPNLLPEKVYSEASIGKGYIREMGIQPWQKMQPDFPRQMLANIMGSYFGGRSEVHIRREIWQVILCDFLSMYPTVCTLMGLWPFIIADGMTWRDATVETRALLETVDIAALQDQALWKRLSAIVQVLPEGDIFPVRAAYSGEAQTTIGANHLTSDCPLWFTLADCIAAKLLTGKSPKVIEAVAFAPGPVQPDLRSVDISGNPDYRVDPATADYFKRVIELRQSVKVKRDAATGDERDALDIEQNALKIAANATSYGMYAEVNVATLAKRVSTTVHGSTCAPFSFASDKVEEPGPFFHPVVAALITGAARLMLAIAERHVVDHDLEWAFCDTDSMAIAKPAEMDSEDFARHVTHIVDWFAALNPYDFGGSILKIEDENACLDTGLPAPLYCFAVSSKRYALFNIAADGAPIMRKVSAHGLGHLLPPYGDDGAPAYIPTPHKSVFTKGILRWHSDLWWHVIRAALAGTPEIVPLTYHPGLRAPAISRYGATTPELLRWFSAYNRDRNYRDQVKPFGFLLSMSAKWCLFGERIADRSGKSRRSKTKAVKPIAPFDRDFGKAVAVAFDRESGASVPKAALKSYADALAQYHLQPESKFLNADYFDRGVTLRRHIRMTATRHIGKESNDWERQAVLGFSADTQPNYGIAENDRTQLVYELTSLVAQIGLAKAEKALGITSMRLKNMNVESLPQLVAARLPAAIHLFSKLDHARQAELYQLRAAVERDGLRFTARRLGVDPSNLRRKIAYKI
ncbi:hypothetical protein [Sphingomonas cavernae]|nr:hypothetical protein [Sphingomonas cavernae]